MSVKSILLASAIAALGLTTTAVWAGDPDLTVFDWSGLDRKSVV